MGKPFEKELNQLVNTYKLATTINIDLFKAAISKTLMKPLYIIGSGGSLSACHFAEILHQESGMIGKAMSPLESFYLQKSLHHGNVLIITAGGKNKDILFAFDQALNAEPQFILNLCASSNSPLAKRACKFDLSSTFEFPLPTGKDGFLASNSLLAFFILLARIYNFHINRASLHKTEIQKFKNEVDVFLAKMGSTNPTFAVLYGGWSKPVAIDIESKLTEAALANSLLADFRNFGHGRHHWFDKKRKNSAIISLASGYEEELAEKTLNLLPKDIPILRINSDKNSAAATIELLIKSFYLIDKIGKLQGIDPGRPGVPGFGSKLYRLSYTRLYKKSQAFDKSPYYQIQRKLRPENISDLTQEKLKKWVSNYKKYVATLSSTRFGSIVLDYDRTLCSEENRLLGPNAEIAEELSKILKAGFLVGIVTGRGSSVKKDLRKCLPEKYWPNVFIGYYNGAEIGSLSDDNHPDGKEGNESIFVELRRLFKETAIGKEIQITQRTSQLTIECSDPSEWESIKSFIYQKAMTVRNAGFMILESSRSLDIIKRPSVSKLNILNYLKKQLEANNLAQECLCIGDKGKWPGNDFELLGTPFSLSVNEVSLDPHSCWNLAPLGIRNTGACFLYLRAINFKKGHFTFSV